jgi:hypothetical protein
VHCGKILSLLPCFCESVLQWNQTWKVSAGSAAAETVTDPGLGASDKPTRPAFVCEQGLQLQEWVVNNFFLFSIGEMKLDALRGFFIPGEHLA